MVVSPDLHPQPDLYKVEVTLRLVDRLLSELDLEPLGDAATDVEQQNADVSDPGLTGRVVHALKLTETLTDGADDPLPARALQRQLQTTLRGLLLELERSAPRREAV